MHSTAPHLVLHDHSPQAEGVKRLLADVGVFRFRHIEDVTASEASETPNLLVVVDLSADHAVPRLKSLNLHLRTGEERHVFAVRSGSRREAVQAGALGATSTLPLPLTRAAIAQAFRKARPADQGYPWHDAPRQLAEGLNAAADMLSQILGPKFLAGPDFGERLTACAETISDSVEFAGIGAWLRAVRGHHSPTFKHCLLVAGYAAAFAQALRFSRGDRNLLLIAGLVHDVGKSEIPLAILDKPGPLDMAEMALMRTHASRGYHLLSRSTEIGPDILDVVLHHHEYLDGSGYPDRLSGDEIGDLTRLTTIADIFSALLEPRSYKGPMPAEEAWRRMRDMGNKLDQPLVEAFRPVALASSA